MSPKRKQHTSTEENDRFDRDGKVMRKIAVMLVSAAAMIVATGFIVVMPIVADMIVELASMHPVGVDAV